MIDREALDFLLHRAFGDLQLKILKLFKRYNIVTPTILVQEDLFAHAKARKIALATQALKQLMHLGLVERVAEGHYRLTPLGKKIVNIIPDEGLGCQPAQPQKEDRAGGGETR